jgi:hypothetical protein
MATTVNSLSGGASSSYMFMHYPADVEMFALVCNSDPDCRIKDSSVMDYANAKLDRYSPYYGELKGIAENHESVKAIMDLEQMTGREIIWVRGMDYDELCIKRQAIPNMAKRFCTTFLKILPMIYHLRWHMSLDDIDMRIGIRHDEQERSATLTTRFKFPWKSNFYKASKVKPDRWEQQWVDVEWRKVSTPMIDDIVFTYTVNKYWHGQKVKFPKDSNCPFCFWKNENQLRRNHDESPSQMIFADKIEKKIGHTFKNGISMEEISNLKIQHDLFYGGGSGCQAGYCTD